MNEFVYLMTKSERLAKCRFWYVSSNGLYALLFDNNTTYFADPTNVYSIREGEQMLCHGLADMMLQYGYEAVLNPDYSIRVWRASIHGNDGGHTLRYLSPGLYSCTCACYMTYEFCEHVYGLPSLLRYIAIQLHTSGLPEWDIYLDMARLESAPETYFERNTNDVPND